MIKIGNGIWRTLDQPIYIDGKVVKEVYVDRVRVYPESLYGDDNEYVIVFRGRSDLRLPCEITYGDLMNDEIYRIYNWWGGEDDYQSIYEYLHNEQEYEFWAGGIKHTGKTIRKYYTSELSYVMIVRMKIRDISKESRLVYERYHTSDPNIKKTMCKIEGVNLQSQRDSIATLRQSGPREVGTLLAKPPSFHERLQAKCVILMDSYPQILAYKVESRNLSVPLMGPAAFFGPGGSRIDYCYVLEPVGDSFKFNDFSIKREYGERIEKYSGSPGPDWDMSIYFDNSGLDYPPLHIYIVDTRRVDETMPGIMGIEFEMNLGRGNPLAPYTATAAHFQEPQKAPVYLRIGPVGSTQINMAPIDEILYIGKLSETPNYIYDLSRYELL